MKKKLKKFLLFKNNIYTKIKNKKINIKINEKNSPLQNNKKILQLL